MPRPHQSGRLSKLTPKVHKAIVVAIRGGMAVSRAAELIGIRGPTALQWVARGETHAEDADLDPIEAPYVAFARDVRKAQAHDERQRIKRIAEAGKGGQLIAQTIITQFGKEIRREERLSVPDWKADAWHLERTRPKEWGQRADVYVKLDIQKLVARYAELHDLDTEAIMAEAERLVKLLPMEFEDDSHTHTDQAL